MEEQFVAIDFETANEDLASICQVGLANFNGAYIGGSCMLVNPEDEFSGLNISIHGITEEQVQSQPTFRQLYQVIADTLTGKIVACHTAFDRAALTQVCRKYSLTVPECRWLDTARVVRRCWPEQFAQQGYGLRNVAAFSGIEFVAHNALEDARCAGEILLRAMRDSRLTLSDWIERSTKCISAAPVHRDGNPDGPLHGEVVVFTGSLSQARRFAADRASAAGCRVDEGVTKHTTILVVGDQDIRRLAGKEKSSKHLKAEALISKGQRLRVVTERDFLEATAN